MTIEAMIAEARARQQAQTDAYREEQERRAQQAGETLRNQFVAAFGDDMLATLEGYVNSSFDDVARITFRYQDRRYSLRRRYSNGVCDWVLTWMAPRPDGDDRRLPSATISERRRDDQANIDAFVLALAELAESDDTPRHALDELPEPPAPRVMNEFEERLIDSLRQYLQSEL